MRNLVLLLAALSVVSAVGCGGSEDDLAPGSGATAGTAGTTSGAAGSTSTGGSSGAAGTTSTGGSAGSSATGGSSGSSGSAGTAGSSAGTSGTGGDAGTAGDAGTGGGGTAGSTSGTSGTSGTAGTTAGTAGTAASAGSSGTAGTAGSTDCDSCATAVASMSDADICPDQQENFDNFVACVCEPGGACASACGSNACMGMNPSSGCMDCLNNATSQGCGLETAACYGSGSNCDPDYTCSQATAIDGSADPTKLCQGNESSMLFSALEVCACQGACASQCSSTLCVGSQPSNACVGCIFNQNGCGSEYQACSQDTPNGGNGPSNP